MKKLSTFVLLAILFVCQATAKDFAVLFIGNSLTQSAPSWCHGEGWEWITSLVNTDSTRLGMDVITNGILRGATDIPGQWNADLAAGAGACSGIDELNKPTGCHVNRNYPDQSWIASLSHYDYVVLQGFRWAPPFDTEYKYMSDYCDLALQNGTKPIIFACWEDPINGTDTVIAAYDSLYHKYRSHGAILVPLLQAHRLVWNDPTKNAQTYLYVSGDPYQHVNWVGGYLMQCVFYEVFTGHSALEINYSSLCANCSDLDSNVGAANAAYCASIAHQAVINYYGQGNVPHLGGTATNTISNPPVLRQSHSLETRNVRAYCDLSGRLLKDNGAFHKSGICIARDQDGKLSQLLVTNESDEHEGCPSALGK